MQTYEKDVLLLSLNGTRCLCKAAICLKEARMDNFMAATASFDAECPI